jgi:beta-galactosidase
VATYREGKPWAKAEVRTAQAPAALKVEVDRREIAADGRDLAFVTVQVVDRDGNPVPRADPSIHFSVQGPGEVVATDNGDATSFESFQSPRRKAFNGLCLAIVRAKPGARGPIRIQASATDLAPATVEIRPL